ncbi:MAG: BON domain-containing protein [Bryobacterales bacterium]|nr:BON domain-containing protein [Bryobacterales bacterium]MBV9397377.1 BON domain-containing protein [Bryobacterales bacterium]
MCTIKPTVNKIAIVLGLSAFAIALPASAQTPATSPDNSRANKTATPTADQQKENATDRKLAQDIRKSITGDKSLSTYAHNVKVVVQGGTVTLKGPVRSEEEKAAVEAKVKEVAGTAPVQNDLTVASKENTSPRK